MSKCVVSFTVIVADSDRAALAAAVAAMHGREFPAVPSSWVSQARVSRVPTGAAKTDGAALDGRTGDEASYENDLEDGSVEY